MRNLTDAAAKL